MIKHMDKVFINMETALLILVIGLKINNMEKELRHGLMVQNMKEFIKMVKKMDPVFSNLLMEVFILDFFFKMKFQEQESMYGQMEKLMKVNG
jgi:hypothetical protein